MHMACFRVDPGYVGEPPLPTGRIELSLSTALSAASHGLGITLGMTLIYPVQCRVVTRRTRLNTVRLANLLRRCGNFPRYGELCFRHVAGFEKIRERRKK